MVPLVGLRRRTGRRGGHRGGGGVPAWPIRRRGPREGSVWRRSG